MKRRRGSIPDRAHSGKSATCQVVARSVFAYNGLNGPLFPRRGVPPLRKGGGVMLQIHPRGRGALLSLLFLIAVMPLLAACGGSTTAAGLDGSHWNLSA